MILSRLLNRYRRYRFSKRDRTPRKTGLAFLTEGKI